VKRIPPSWTAPLTIGGALAAVVVVGVYRSGRSQRRMAVSIGSQLHGACFYLNGLLITDLYPRGEHGPLEHDTVETSRNNTEGNATARFRVFDAGSSSSTRSSSTSAASSCSSQLTPPRDDRRQLARPSHRATHHRLANCLRPPIEFGLTCLDHGRRSAFERVMSSWTSASRVSAVGMATGMARVGTGVWDARARRPSRSRCASGVSLPLPLGGR
jgi:hypothetical protein